MIQANWVRATLTLSLGLLTLESVADSRPWMDESIAYEAAIVGDLAHVISIEKRLANLEILLGLARRNFEDGSITINVGRGPETIYVREDRLIGSRRLRQQLAEAQRHEARLPSTTGTFRAGLWLNNELLAMGQVAAREKELEVTLPAVEAFAIRKNISRLRLDLERQRKSLEDRAQEDDRSLMDFERDLPRIELSMTTVEIRPNTN